MNNKTIEQEELLYSKLAGETKKDYFVDAFISGLCFALRDARKERGMTQSDIAKLMGIKQSYVSKMENYEKVPTIETVAKYLYALGCPITKIDEVVNGVTRQTKGLPQFGFLSAKR